MPSGGGGGGVTAIHFVLKQRSSLSQDTDLCSERLYCLFILLEK